MTIHKCDVLFLDQEGAIPVPAEVLARRGWKPGTSLVALDADSGLVLMHPDEAINLLRARLAGSSPLADLLAERQRSLALEEEGIL